MSHIFFLSLSLSLSHLFRTFKCVHCECVAVKVSSTTRRNLGEFSFLFCCSYFTNDFEQIFVENNIRSMCTQCSVVLNETSTLGPENGRKREMEMAEGKNGNSDTKQIACVTILLQRSPK